MNREIELFLELDEYVAIKTQPEFFKSINSQEHFDTLFCFLTHPQKRIMVRSATVIESVSWLNPMFLLKHRRQLFEMIELEFYSEIRHILLVIIKRLDLSHEEINGLFAKLAQWAMSKNEDRHLRVTSLNEAFQFSCRFSQYETAFRLMLAKIKSENDIWLINETGIPKVLHENRQHKR